MKAGSIKYRETLQLGVSLLGPKPLEQEPAMSSSQIVCCSIGGNMSERHPVQSRENPGPGPQPCFLSFSFFLIDGIEY